MAQRQHPQLSAASPPPATPTVLEAALRRDLGTVMFVVTFEMPPTCNVWMNVLQELTCARDTACLTLISLLHVQSHPPPHQNNTTVEEETVFSS